MSSSLAHATPVRSPREAEPNRRHIEIVTTRVQRRARPRVAYAIITVFGLFGILMAQLLLSIMLSDGAYQISALQVQQRSLTRSQQGLSEQLDVLNSPQNLAGRAEALGMVSNASPAFLRLSDAVVLGSPVAATAAVGGVVGASGSNLIPNSLLATLPVTAQSVPGTTATTTRTNATGTAVPGAPAASQPIGSVASTTGALPAPITR
jgi:hypothetical protein